MPSTIRSLSRSDRGSSEAQRNPLQNVLVARLVRRSQQLIAPLSLMAAAICIGIAVFSENVFLSELSKASSILFVLNLLRLLKGPKQEKL